MPEMNSSVPVADSQFSTYSTGTALPAGLIRWMPGQVQVADGVGFSSQTLKFAHEYVSCAIEKTITTMAYGANAFTTSAGESPSGRPTLRTCAGSSTAPPATTGVGVPLSYSSRSLGFHTRTSRTTDAAEMSAAKMSQSL